MDNFALKNIAIQAGLSQDKIVDLYDQSIIEAKHLGKEDDEQFVLSIVKTLAGLDEEDLTKTIQNLNTKFLESGYSDFNKYLEDMWASGGPGGGIPDGIVSTDFPQSVRPENALGHKLRLPPDEENEEEDEEKIQ